MAKLDRLVWAADMRLVAYGTRVGIRVSDASIMNRLPALLPPGWRPEASPMVNVLYSLIVGGPGPRPSVHRYHVLYRGATRLRRTLDAEDALRALESDIRLRVAEWARRKLFVHAGVVGWGDGAIVIPGYSFSGKSTLVDALIRAGAAYYSDEYAVLDARGRVHPFPVALSLRAGRSGPPERPFPPGRAIAARPLPVGLVLVTRHREAARWRPRPLSDGQAVLALLAHTVPARRRPAAALTMLRQAVAGAVVVRGARGETEEVVEWLLRRRESGKRREPS